MLNSKELMGGYRNSHIIITILIVIFNFIQITMDYVIRFEFFGVIASVYGMWKNYAHVLLSATIFFVLLELLRKWICSEKAKKVLDFADKYSYAIYLTHHIYLIGPLEIVSKFSVASVCLTFICIILNAVLLKHLSDSMVKVAQKISRC